MSCWPFTGDRTRPSPRLPPSPNIEHPIGAHEKDGALVTAAHMPPGGVISLAPPPWRSSPQPRPPIGRVRCPSPLATGGPGAWPPQIRQLGCSTSGHGGNQVADHIGGSVRGATSPTSVSGTGLCGTGRTTLSRGSGQYGATAGSSVVLAPMRVAAVLPLRGGQMRGGCRQAEDRHVAVDGLVFPGPDPERLVPDPDVVPLENSQRVWVALGGHETCPRPVPGGLAWRAWWPRRGWRARVCCPAAGRAAAFSA